MYTEDKITKGSEIKQAGLFENNGNPFYLFLMPVSESAGASAVISCKLAYEDYYQEFPFTANAWSPTVVNGVNIKSQDLTNYRIFYGMED